jgi:hypothetical protein
MTHATFIATLERELPAEPGAAFPPALGAIRLEFYQVE